MLFVSLVLAVGVACGSSAKRKPLAVTARVIRAGEFAGYAPGSRTSFKTPEGYLVGSNLTFAQRKAWTARLSGEGFKQDVTEFLTRSQGPQTGLSGVMQLGSAASARAELAAERRSYKRQFAQRFPVKTIPGAFGYGFSGSGEGGENILFADGPFLYIVGYGWLGNARNSKHSALVEAATKLYARVHGHPAS